MYIVNISVKYSIDLITKDNCELSDHAEGEVVYHDVANQKVDDSETANQNHDPVQTELQYQTGFGS